MAENLTPLNINERLLQIIDPELIRQRNPKADPRACWLDSEECPYGQPHGQFANRPKGLCRIGTCLKLIDIPDDIDEISGDYIRKRIANGIIELFHEVAVTLAVELRTIADEEFGGDEDGYKLIRDVIALTADILEAESAEKASNPKILSEDSFFK